MPQSIQLVPGHTLVDPGNMSLDSASSDVIHNIKGQTFKKIQKDLFYIMLYVHEKLILITLLFQCLFQQLFASYHNSEQTPKTESVTRYLTMYYKLPCKSGNLIFKYGYQYVNKIDHRPCRIGRIKHENNISFLIVDKMIFIYKCYNIYISFTNFVYTLLTWVLYNSKLFPSFRQYSFEL